ncbi:DUF6344 domain-containing protein [Streptomyces sp. NPDC006296]|uniref:DUF6344 domain-containing protein n=1 Tax=Streptomyces sp. NPDC006296 TaxID=3156746 RepID=UPI0033AD43F6
MSTFKAKSIWTAFITAFFAILASLGLATAQATAAEATVTSHEHTAAHPATATTPSVRWTLPRDRALPPTMKQRIRAEAHGSSPATRQLAADSADAVNATDGTRSGHSASPAGDSAPLPP